MIDWLGLLAVQETLKSLLPAPKFKSINSSMLILPYGPTLTSIPDDWKTHSFHHTDICQWIMSLLFNILSKFVIAFLLRSKHLLISCLQSPSAVILEHKKIVCHCFHCFPNYLSWSDIYLLFRILWFKLPFLALRWKLSQGFEHLKSQT